MERDEANTVLVHSLRNTPSETFVLTHDVTLGWATVLIAAQKQGFMEYMTKKQSCLL